MHIVHDAEGICQLSERYVVCRTAYVAVSHHSDRGDVDIAALGSGAVFQALEVWQAELLRLLLVPVEVALGGGIREREIIALDICIDVSAVYLFADFLGFLSEVISHVVKSLHVSLGDGVILNGRLGCIIEGAHVVGLDPDRISIAVIKRKTGDVLRPVGVGPAHGLYGFVQADCHIHREFFAAYLHAGLGLASREIPVSLLLNDVGEKVVCVDENGLVVPPWSMSLFMI